MKRKIYNELINWKNTELGRTALLIDGARRVGKSYIAEEFAKNEYKSYIMIDFNRASEDIKDLFANYLEDLDMLFMYLFDASSFLPCSKNKFNHCNPFALKVSPLLILS